MAIISTKAKFWINNWLGNIARESIPEHILGRLSGIGQAPQFFNSVNLAAIQNAFNAARYGETYWLYGLFRDTILNDTRISSAMGKRLMSFVGQQETIEPYDKANTDDVAAAEAIVDMISNCENWREGCLHLAGGHIWPVAGAEKIFEAVPASELHRYKHPVRYRLKKIHPIPYELFNYRVSYWGTNGMGFGPNSGQNVTPMMTTTGSIPITDGSYSGSTALNDAALSQENPALIWNPDDWEPDLRFYGVQGNTGVIDWSMASCYKADPNRHVIHRANVAGAAMKDNYGGSTMGGLLFWSFLGQQGRDWFSRAMERYASPFVLAYANTANKNIFDLLAKAFNQATKLNALIVPPQTKIELKEVMANGMADSYAKFIELCNTEKTNAILGEILSTSPKNTGLGSGVADLQGEVRSDWRIYDEKAFGHMERTQIFEQYLRINGFKGRAPHSIRGGLTMSNQSLLARTYRDFSQAGVFIDPSSAPDLSKMLGLKVRIVDPMEMQLKLAEAKGNQRESGEERE